MRCPRAAGLSARPGNASDSDGRRRRLPPPWPGSKPEAAGPAGQEGSQVGDPAHPKGTQAAHCSLLESPLSWGVSPGLDPPQREICTPKPGLPSFLYQPSLELGSQTCQPWVEEFLELQGSVQNWEEIGVGGTKLRA